MMYVKRLFIKAIAKRSDRDVLVWLRHDVSCSPNNCGVDDTPVAQQTGGDLCSASPGNVPIGANNPCGHQITVEGVNYQWVESCVNTVWAQAAPGTFLGTLHKVDGNQFVGDCFATSHDTVTSGPDECGGPAGTHLSWISMARCSVP
jgi:hypothetical protein